VERWAERRVAPEYGGRRSASCLDSVLEAGVRVTTARRVPPEEAADAVQDLFADLGEKDFAAQLAHPSKGVAVRG
jgi:hypothetical protein